MSTFFNIATVVIFFVMIAIFCKINQTNNSLRIQLYEQRSCITLAMQVRDRTAAKAQVIKRISSYAVIIIDSNLPCWSSEILIKEYDINDDETYARLLAEELCDKINESPYEPSIS